MNGYKNRVLLSDKIYIESENGTKTVTKTNDLKIITGDDKVIDFPEKTNPTKFTFKGKGWGHAVGLSQNGARAFAKKGYKFDEILQHYFQGTTVG